MIQSGKFDSLKMNIKKIANSALLFTIKRLIEFIAIIISIIGLLLLVSLISYSPNDPNFIFPDSTKINNFLGLQGSYISDLFFSISRYYCLFGPNYFFVFRNIYI